MKDVIKKITEMILDERFEEIKNELKLVKYQYEDYCNEPSNDLVDDIILELLNSFDKIRATLKESNLINDHKFKSQISLEFYKFLINKGLSQKTAYDYVKRINRICNIDSLINQDIQFYIDEYTIGSKKEENKRFHNAPSSALKKLNEFKKEMNL